MGVYEDLLSNLVVYYLKDSGIVVITKGADVVAIVVIFYNMCLDPDITCPGFITANPACKARGYSNTWAVCTGIWLWTYGSVHIGRIHVAELKRAMMRLQFSTMMTIAGIVS